MSQSQKKKKERDFVSTTEDQIADMFFHPAEKKKDDNHNLEKNIKGIEEAEENFLQIEKQLDKITKENLKIETAKKKGDIVSPTNNWDKEDLARVKNKINPDKKSRK